MTFGTVDYPSLGFREDSVGGVSAGTPSTIRRWSLPYGMVSSFFSAMRHTAAATAGGCRANGDATTSATDEEGTGQGIIMFAYFLETDSFTVMV